MLFALQSKDIGETYITKKEAKSISLELIETDTQTDGEYIDDIEHNICDNVDPSACNELEHNTQLISFVYHVLYHRSYGVPYLCFNAYKSGI